MTSPERLRFITYLSPGLPVEIFETLMYYLEEVTERDAYIIYESRWSSPPPERDDPLITNEADIGFMCFPGLFQLLKRNKDVELCQAAPVFYHPMAAQKPVYFSDVIVRADNEHNFRNFDDLKGRSFAFNDYNSLSGFLVVLGELKNRGYDTDFFGDLQQSGSHNNSIKMVLEGDTDFAAIDSNTLRYYLNSHPYDAERIKIVTSLGPMPIQPVVFNKRLPEKIKTKITQALLDIHEKPEWINKLRKYNLDRFTPIDLSFYNMETRVLESVQDMRAALCCVKK